MNVLQEEFQHLPLISHHTQQHDPMEVDLHQPQLDLEAFKTCEEQMSEDHKSKTLKFTEVVPLTPLCTKALEKSPSRLAAIPPFQLDIPATVKKISPSSNQLHRLTPMGLAPSLRQHLDNELSAMTNPISTLGGVFNPITGTVYTAEGQGSAMGIFFNVCHLLTHHKTRHLLWVGVENLPMDALLYVREPCGLFCREILAHLQKTSASNGFMPSFFSFIEALLRPAQIHLSGVYDPYFFSGAFLHTFLSVESWMVSTPSDGVCGPRGTPQVRLPIGTQSLRADS
jgi:hypothetical protein